jgi:hypothetical protein
LPFSNRFQPPSHRPSAPSHADPIAPGDRQTQEVREMRPSQHIKPGLAVTLVLAAISAPAASAHAGWVVRLNPDQQAAQLASAAATLPSTTNWVVRPNPDEQYPMPAPITLVRVTDPNGGFDWGDAGIGAAGTLGLILAATGGTLLLARRRHNPPPTGPRTAH